MQVATITLFEFVDSEAGRAAILEGVDDALRAIRIDLPSVMLGGTELAYNVSVTHPKTASSHIDIVREHITCDTPDPEGGKYDYSAIASQKQDVSLRTGVSVRETMQRGWLQKGDVEWIGNAVACLDKEGDYKLIVSCSGLSDLDDEAAAELIAAYVKRRLLRAFNYALAA